MSGIMMGLIASGPGFSTVASPRNYAPQKTVAGTVQCTVNTDGTISGDATDTWGTPAIAGIGALYWLQVTNVSGSGTMTGGTFGSPLQLNASQTFSMGSAALGFAKTRHCTYQIATDSGMSNVVLSGNMDFTSDLT